MKSNLFPILVVTVGLALAGCATAPTLPPQPGFEKVGDVAVLVLPAENGGAVRLGGFFYETAQGRVALPAELEVVALTDAVEAIAKLKDGRVVKISAHRDATRAGKNFDVALSAQPAAGIVKWGFAVDAAADEYFTGVMERVVDGPQEASWRRGITEAMNLRGQKVEMIVKPTTSVYAPFYVSSRGYGVFAQTNWPGTYDFCASDPAKVQIAFEGPALACKVYTATAPATIVQAHALDAGPPFLPPRWMYSPWRWRDEHTQRAAYYDGTKVTGPFNSEFMEDVLLMRAYGIPCGVYWIDRPWGPGPMGYDDFKIDERRLPNFAASVKWLEAQHMKMVLWIGVFLQGDMMKEGLAKGYTLAGQKRPSSGNNYPVVDLSNPAAKAYWQAGVEKLLNLGVAGFKLDRGEEDMPDDGPFKRFDGVSIRENRNGYVARYAQAVAEIARKHRGEDFVAMPRGAYTGSSPHAVFWGGDIGGTPEGLRESIIAVQRSAVMGYPNWGSDTCGYSEQTCDRDLCARWLGFSCFTPIMEVGPTRNEAFWHYPTGPGRDAEKVYDANLIAVWRLYARLHERLGDYLYAQAQEATQSGLPIVRPLFLVDAAAPAAWANWWTFACGPDLVVSPIWEKGKRDQQVYLPAGAKWRDAWQPEKIYDGGQAIDVHAELHQVPIFVRDGAAVAKAVGDLGKEWLDSVTIAKNPPDLQRLDAEVKAWFETSSARSPAR
ncbi:MAG TPA: TIM-barrel domain-containing protein [Opitutaceae bacterium]|nr:TIM-barrel domain-containing protein [Opitutaceae bacterium]